MPYALPPAPKGCLASLRRGWARDWYNTYALINLSGSLRAVRVAARADGLLGLLADAPRGLEYCNKL